MLCIIAWETTPVKVNQSGYGVEIPKILYGGAPVPSNTLAGLSEMATLQQLCSDFKQKGNPLR
jgi:hypothetical protein